MLIVRSINSSNPAPCLRVAQLVVPMCSLHLHLRVGSHSPRNPQSVALRKRFRTHHAFALERLAPRQLRIEELDLVQHTANGAGAVRSTAKAQSTAHRLGRRNGHALGRLVHLNDKVSQQPDLPGKKVQGQFGPNAGLEDHRPTGRHISVGAIAARGELHRGAVG